MTFDIGEAVRLLREGKAIACHPVFNGYLKLIDGQIKRYDLANSKPGRGAFYVSTEAFLSTCWTLHEEPKEYVVEYYLVEDGRFAGSDVISVEGDVQSFVVSELGKQKKNMYAVVKGHGINMMVKKEDDNVTNDVLEKEALVRRADAELKCQQAKYRVRKEAYEQATEEYNKAKNKQAMAYDMLISANICCELAYEEKVKIKCDMTKK